MLKPRRSRSDNRHGPRTFDPNPPEAMERRRVMPTPIFPAVLCGLALACPIPGLAAVLSGTVRPPTSSGTSVHSPNAYAGRASSLPGRHEVRKGTATDAVVYVSAVPPGADPHPSPAARTLAQRDQAFVPRVLPVAVGWKVDFPNFDPIFHNAFSVSPAKRFDLGKYAQGKSRQVTFDREGVVNVFCDIHSSMAAWILVLPHDAFAQPGADGAFRLPDLPPGRYELVVWHPDLPTIKRVVELPAGGATVEVRW